jgi:hypothetical protein
MAFCLHAERMSESSPRSVKENLIQKRSRLRDARGKKIATPKTAIRRSLKDSIRRFRAMEKLLLSASEVDERLLCDFRAAVNRVRTTAWGVQQYVSRKETGQDATNVLTILTGERVRVAYNLCCTLSSDLKRTDVAFQAGSLVELQEAAQKLGADVGVALKKMR